MNSDTLIWISVAFAALSAALALIAALKANSASRRLTLVHQLVGTLQNDAETVRRSLTDDLQRGRAEADSRGRDLRQELGVTLQGGFARADDASRALREEVLNLVKALGETVSSSIGQLGTVQAEKLDSATGQVRTLGEANERRLLDMRKDGDESAKALREEVARQLQALSTTIVQNLVQGAESQKERLGAVTMEISNLSQRNADAQEALKRTLEGRLDALRQENTFKLEEMRQTVDEKLQSTLEKRLTTSFKLVSDQLESVFKSVGEMQSLASGVGDLKRVLSNVKARGTWAEVSLGGILEEVMAPEQFARSVQVNPNSGERVDFAIKLPDLGEHGCPLWLPIDAKFPTEDYDRLVDASDRADVAGIEAALKGLETRVRNEGASICEKYIAPPYTTDFGILYLPTEGLYAEVIRRAGLVDDLQRKSRIVVAGPTVLLAILNSLRMGFRTLAIQKRSSEVWQVLGAFKSEFGKYGAVLEGVKRKLHQASSQIEDVSVRHRAIDRTLKQVEGLPDGQAARLLDLSPIDNLPAFERNRETQRDEFHVGPDDQTALNGPATERPLPV